jgi:hypothetical protein
MAFHPLRYFQKHQKTFLAGITIVAMLTFVFSSGLSKGDFFSWVVQLVGGEGRYQRVATLYGKSLDSHDLGLVQQRRLLANQYMAGAVEMATQTLGQKVMQASAKWDEQSRYTIFEALQRAQTIQMYGNFLPASQKVDFARESFGKLRFLRERFLDQKETDKAQVVERVFRLLNHALTDRPAGPFYFGGSNTEESTLDFLIWRHQADQLGIRLTETDVKRLAQREAMDQLDADQTSSLVKALLRNHANTRFEDLLSALNDEFRVRMAQSALTGYDPGSAAQVPTPITPDEFWDYFREYRTEVSTALVPISVEEFKGLVTEKPKDQQLENLFEKYKEQEYNPALPTPGFKQPRRLAIEWVGAKPDSPHYKQAAEKAAAVLQAINPGAFQALLIDQYETSVKFGASGRLPPLTEPAFLLSFYTEPVKPEGAAGTFGLILGAANARSSPLTVLAGHQAAAIARADKEKAAAAEEEIKRRKPLLARLGAVGLTGSPLQFLAAWDEAGRQPQYLPMAAVRTELLKKVQESLARELLTNSLNTVKKELENRKNRPEEARKYLAEAVKKYGLEQGSTEKPRDQYDIGADKGLAALKDAYVKSQRTQDPRARAFARMFFNSTRVYEAQQWPGGMMMAPGDEMFLYWKTSDKPAYVPKFAEVRGQVEDAWKFEQARALAKKEADDLAAKARDSDKGALAVLTQGSAHSGTMFTLDSVARLRPKPLVRVGLSRVYEPYPIPDDKIEYPRPDLVDRLLTLKEPKQTIVLDDRPEAVFYVAAMMPGTYRVPTEQQFYSVYRNAAEGALMADPLFRDLENARRERYRQACLEQLRAEAKLTIVHETRRKSSTPEEEPPLPLEEP